MQTSAFDRTARMLVCPNCGGPVDVPPSGGDVKCGYCRQSSRWQGFSDAPEIAARARRSPVDEFARLRRLREQDGRPVLPPASLTRFLVGGELPDQLYDEALAEWQRARVELEQSALPGVGERLFFLTLMLIGALGRHHRDAQLRALAESAIEVLQGARERQVLRCVLARNAAHAGDLAAAEQWLAPCDPVSDDLVADSSYRFTVAYFATCRGDWPRVLQVVGANLDDVPIADSNDVAVTVLRANAFERMGRVGEAVALLEAQAARSHTHVRDYETVRSSHPRLDLAPQSIATLQSREQSKLAAQRASGAAGGGLGPVWIVLGPLIFVGLCLIVASFFLPDYLSIPGFSGPWFFRIMGGTFVVISLAVALFLLRLLGGGDDALLQTGLDARAQVIAVEPTGWSVNDVPQYRLRLRVFLDGRAPYDAQLSLVLDERQLAAIQQPGTSLTVKVDRANPLKLVPVPS